MSSFPDQLPALIGVVIGSVATVMATTLADRARWGRSQSVRWDERRLEAYADYAKAIKEISALAQRMTAEYRPGARVHVLDRQTALALLADANVRRTTAWEPVLMLGDGPSVTAAREWRFAVLALESLAVAEPFDSAAWTPAVQRVDEARDGFYVAARASLGVGGGDVGQAEWLDRIR
jgi:hypothetical protein